MMKNEFEKIVGHEVSQEEYDVIETVYMSYPGELQKDTVAKMYNESGYILFRDLYKRAAEIKMFENQILDLQNRLAKLR